MKKILQMVGVVSAAFLIVGCQNSEGELEELNAEPVDESPVENNGGDDNEELEKEDDVDENENESSENTEEESFTGENDEKDVDAYASTQQSPPYLIDTHYTEAEVDGIIRFYTTFSIKREEDQDLSREETLKASLIEGDPSEQNILSSFADISVEGTTLHLHFNVDGNELSATSAQSSLFYDSLFGISDLFGIEEVLFLNSEGENDIIVAERGINEPILIQQERGLTRGYYTIYDEDLQETLFLPSGELDEQVADNNGEPLSFSETLEAMQSVDREDAFYSSAIVEGLEIVHSSLENGVATVQYTMEELITESDLIVFERAIQLAALDFHAEEVRVINDTTEESTTYPLVGQ